MRSKEPMIDMLSLFLQKCILGCSRKSILERISNGETLLFLNTTSMDSVIANQNYKEENERGKNQSIETI
jgi:hypothetical protein